MVSQHFFFSMSNILASKLEKQAIKIVLIEQSVSQW